MDMEKFLRELFESGRFRHDFNLMDRKVYINRIGDASDIEIESIEVDYKGDICINISEEATTHEE